MIKLFSSFFHPIPSDYELWLEKKASAGQYPTDLSDISSVVMKFRKDVPKKYRYVLDIQKKEDSDYIHIYEDFGWEFCGKVTNAYIWRKEYSDERPQSFTDRQTRKDRNAKFTKSVLICMIIQLVIEVLITAFFILNFSLFSIPAITVYGAVLLLSYVYTAYLLRIVLKTQREVD